MGDSKFLFVIFPALSNLSINPIFSFSFLALLPSLSLLIEGKGLTVYYKKLKNKSIYLYLHNLTKVYFNCLFNFYHRLRFKVINLLLSSHSENILSWKTSSKMFSSFKLECHQRQRGLELCIYSQ